MEDGTKLLSCNRDNIDVAVEFTANNEERLNKLLKLLRKSEECAKLDDEYKRKYVDDDETRSSFNGILSNGSVIIYVWKQKDAEVVTEQLRAYDISGGVVCYHGGMDSDARSKSQSQFMRGKVRICVATVAFGLGINKADVRGVIHLCLPPSPEHYLQEIGRAGRDGKQAIAIALVLENEFSHKLSLSFSDRLSKAQIQSFILNLCHLTRQYFETLSDDALQSDSTASISLPIGPIVHAVDCKQETIQTFLSVLEDELPSCSKLLDIQGVIPDTATVTLKKRSLDSLCDKEEIAKCIKQCGVDITANPKAAKEPLEYDRFHKFGGTASQKGFLAYSFGVYQCSVINCAQLLGPESEPRHVYAILRRLQNQGEIEVNFSDSSQSIHLKLTQSGMDLFRDDTNQDGWLNQLTTTIYDHFDAQDKSREQKVLVMHDIMRQVSNIKQSSHEQTNNEKSKRLEVFQQLIEEYFSQEDNRKQYEATKNDVAIVENIHTQDGNVLASIQSDVTSLLQHPSLRKIIPTLPHSVHFGVNSHEEYTALAITKILHGIESPRTPILEWYRHPVWGRWRSIHFNSLNQYVQSFIESGVLYTNA